MAEEPVSEEQPEEVEEAPVEVEPTEELPTEFAAHYAAQGEEVGELAAACESGDAVRCRWLGDLSRYGEVSDGLHLGLEAVEDPARAIQLYQRGCFLNDVWACLEMSRMYAEGVLVPENAEMASSLRQSARAGLSEACVLGDSRACVGLGVAEWVLGNREGALDAWSQGCTAGELEGCSRLVVTAVAEGEQLAESVGRLLEGCGTGPEWPWCLAVTERDALREGWVQGCAEGSAHACRLLVDVVEDATEEQLVEWSRRACGADACSSASPDRSSLEGWM